MRLQSTFWTLLIFSLLHSVCSNAQTADLILTNGKVFTSDPYQLYVQAIAIKGNKIMAVGSNEAIIKLRSKRTKQIDLKGSTVIPGFNNAHDHPGWGAPIGKSYNYTETNPYGLSKTSVLDSIKRLVKEASPGTWIYGFIGVAVFQDMTMRAALDSIAPHNPVALQIWWGHGMVVNAKALEATGLSDKAKDPIGGWYIRNASGKINSLQQNAQAPFWIALNNSHPEDIIKALQNYAEKQLQVGITTVQYMGTGFSAAKADSILRRAKLPHRTRIVAFPRSTPEGRQLSDWKKGNDTPTPLSYLSGIKYVIDGSPMEGNALRTTAYPDKPGWYGRFNYPIDTMKQIFKEALTSNQQLIMHITADSSFGVVLTLMNEMASKEQWRVKRVRIEHNCVGDLTGNISTRNRSILKDLGIIMMHTSWYCMASPLRSLLDSGIILGIAPDVTTNPFLEIMLMTSTHSNPKENLTVEQAVMAYTKTNAYAEFNEKTKGTLAKGKVADIAVLSQDIFSIPAQRLPATQSVLTIVDGKIVYQQPGSLIIK